MRLQRAGAVVAGVVLTTAALAGCSGDEPAEQDPGSTASGDAAGTSSAPELDVPAGVELTDQGTELEHGESAEVAWQPREGKVGVLDIDVEKVEQVTLEEFSAFRVDESVRTSTPYFVTASIENVGETPLGDVAVPLYLLDDSDTLVERSTFGSTFRACPSTNLPAQFKPGATAEACLVYLAPRRGEAQAVSFRPTEAFDPITWTGEIVTPRQGGAQGQGGGQRQNQGQN